MRARTLQGFPGTRALMIAGILVLEALGGTRLAKGAAPSGSRLTPPPERRLVLFYTAEVHGTVEPCGCTSDPLGDVSRLATIVAEARRIGAGVALVDAGALLYPDGKISTKERASADLRADFLASAFERIGLSAAALGETDTAGGVGHVRPSRLASNLTGAGSALRAPRVERIGGIAVGILAVADPTAGDAIGAKATDMMESARRDVERLRRQSAEIVILLASVDKGIARQLARESGADLVVLGKRVGHGLPRPEKIGRAFLVAPQEEMQRVGRLDVVLRGPPTPGHAPELHDAGGVEASRLRREEIDRTLERLRVAMASWTASTKGPHATDSGDHADDNFLAAKRREQAELEAERTRLATPFKPPPLNEGSYFLNQLVPLGRGVRRDPAMVAAMKSLDRRIATVNLKQATAPPPAEVGRAAFVGVKACATCHMGATAFWKQTVHARAWKTLVDGGKQADYKCVGCHTVGFGQVGGSSLGYTKNLEAVQCENCHGPGSLHVAAEGNEVPLDIKRAPPETVCLGCHTEQHSDTFQFDAYLRDIVGKGHGEKRRQTLGPGITGHELRAAALKKAAVADTERVKKR